jgi:hypothetical protein
MLAPTDRRLLLDALAPPAGYVFDEAIGTTYTLDLLALLRVPLAATALPWSDRDGGPVDNPFALLSALRRNATRISLYCHAGATKVPARHVGLLSFLEDAVHQVTPPRPGGVFHPKMWLLRFTPKDPNDSIAYRLLVLSRNLTFDRSWDTVLTLDGELLNRQRGLSMNRPLSEFVAALPRMAQAAGTELSDTARARALRFATEVRRVDWWLPDGFDSLTFHPIGHDGRPNWPVTDLRRLMVLSPFMGPEALASLRANVREDFSLVGRFDELAKLAPAALEEIEVEVFDDPAALLDVDDQVSAAAPTPDEADPIELSGLHAKVYVGERGKRAAVFIGSANATDAAFELNVELLVELEGSRKQHGIDAVRDALESSKLLTPFKPAASVAVDEAEEAFERELQRVAHQLATSMRVRVEPAGDDRWRPFLELSGKVSANHLTIRARPLSEPTLRPIDLTASPCCVFPPTGRSSITAFFALRLTGRTSLTERHLDVTVRLPLDGAPDGRIQAVTAELLGDRDRLLRFILLLLSDDGDSDRMLDELEEIFKERAAGAGPNAHRPEARLPLLEPMLRALQRDPGRLDEIDRLLRDVREAGGASDLLPPELEALWGTINELRKARA